MFRLRFWDFCMISHVMGNLRFKGSDITMTEEMLMRLYRYNMILIYIYNVYIYAYNRACCIPIDDFKPPPLFWTVFFVAGCREWLAGILRGLESVGNVFGEVLGWESNVFGVKFPKTFGMYVSKYTYSYMHLHLYSRLELTKDCWFQQFDIHHNTPMKGFLRTKQNPWEPFI